MRWKSRTPEREEPSSDAATRGDDRTALRLIDDALLMFVERNVVPSAEVVDLLLDLRSVLVLDAAFHEMWVDEHHEEVVTT